MLKFDLTPKKKKGPLRGTLTGCSAFRTWHVSNIDYVDPAHVPCGKRSVYLLSVYETCCLPSVYKQGLFSERMSKRDSDDLDEKTTNSLLSWLKRYRGMSDTFVYGCSLRSNLRRLAFRKKTILSLISA